MLLSPTRRTRRRPVSDINVVPYIDVMLVLLVIFMVTAPLLAQGVHVELPNAPAKALSPDTKDPLIVSVDQAGQYFFNASEKPDEPVAAGDLVILVAAQLKLNKDRPILVKGDRNVSYGSVVSAMALLQQAGVPHVGLVTEQPHADDNG